MHSPYEIKLAHPADFRVKYRFYTEAEGGRVSIPHQGYRSDFWYAHDGEADWLFMIWPEFEDAAGNVIFENDVPVSASGTARMWILVPERRPFHRERIKTGLIGYFMEGSRKVAVCEVVQIMGLHTNPIASERKNQ